MTKEQKVYLELILNRVDSLLSANSSLIAEALVNVEDEETRKWLAIILKDHTEVALMVNDFKNQHLPSA